MALGVGGCPPAGPPLLPATPTQPAAPPLPHQAVTSGSIPTHSAQGEGDESPTLGQHKGTSSSVPKGGGPMARPRSDGTSAGEWEQHPRARLQHGPRVVAALCPPPCPPHPDAAAPTLFIFPASWNISCENCLLTGGATGQRAAGDRNPGQCHPPGVLGTIRLQHCSGAHLCATCHPRECHRFRQHTVSGTIWTGCCVPWHTMGCRDMWQLQVLVNAPPLPRFCAHWSHTPEQLRPIFGTGTELPAGRGCCHPCGDPQQHPYPPQSPGYPRPIPLPTPRSPCGNPGIGALCNAVMQQHCHGNG